MIFVYELITNINITEIICVNSYIVYGFIRFITVFVFYFDKKKKKNVSRIIFLILISYTRNQIYI